MASVITAADKIGCGHNGVIAVEGSPQLAVNGVAVVTAAMFAGATVTGCSPPPPPGTHVSKPCTKCDKVSKTDSQALFVNGAPVLVAPVGGQTDGTLADVKPQLLLALLGAPQQTLLDA